MPMDPLLYGVELNLDPVLTTNTVTKERYGAVPPRTVTKISSFKIIVLATLLTITKVYKNRCLLEVHRIFRRQLMSELNQDVSQSLRFVCSITRTGGADASIIFASRKKTDVEYSVAIVGGNGGNCGTHCYQCFSDVRSDGGCNHGKRFFGLLALRHTGVHESLCIHYVR